MPHVIETLMDGCAADNLGEKDGVNGVFIFDVAAERDEVADFIWYLIR